jgi:signal peptidase complex subunit 2
VSQQLLGASFTPSLLHPTVHLALGYSSVIISLGAVLYALRVSFGDSKPVLWVAVIGYSVLQSTLWAWKRWVEKGEVFRGKRRRMVKRVSTGPLSPCGMIPNLGLS